MILPVYTFGDPILREQTVAVEGSSEELQNLIDNMLETMHGAAGIGIAAPQVGRTERVFVVDLSALIEDDDDDDDDETMAWPEQPMVFVNPVIEEDSDDECDFEEGCLSIPDIREDVTRPEAIRIRYRDRHFEEVELEASGMLARVIQHEYDHLEGVLFVDHISAFRRRLLRRKLAAMSEGEVEADYPLAVDLADRRA